MATVTFDHVYKRYSADVVAVNDLNLEIADGEFLVLVGPSGCGKTTALRCVAGLETITDGKLLIGDRVVNDVAPKDRDIAMVFQSYALYPHMSVYDNLAFGLKLRKTPKADIDRRVKEAAGDPGPGQVPGPQAEGTLRRPAPARGAGTGHRARAGRVPHGRAALQPGRQAARPDPRRDRAPAPAAGHHHRLRHPRPGRGHDHGRPDRGHARRPPAAGRHAAGPVRQPGQRLRGRLHRLAGHELRDRQGDRGRGPHARQRQAGALRQGGAGGRQAAARAPTC